MKDSSARRERFLPYAYENAGLALHIDRCVLDGNRAVEPDRDGHVVDATEPWDSATVEGRLVIDGAALDRVLPPGERREPPLEAWLVLRCEATRLRWGERVHAAPLAPGPRPFRLALRRQDLRGSLQILGTLVRAGRGTRQAGFASTQGARVAGSRVWELRVDRKQSIRGQYLEVRYRSFGSDEGIPRHDRGGVFLLDADMESPILWVNSDHQHITRVLESNAASGRHARLRDLFFDHLEQGVWTRLFLHAATQILDEGEAAYPWQEGVIDELLSDLYPELGDKTSRLNKLRYEWEEKPQVMARLGAALQRRSEVAKHMTRLAQEEEG